MAAGDAGRGDRRTTLAAPGDRRPGVVHAVGGGRRTAGQPGAPRSGIRRAAVAAGADLALLRAAPGPLVEPLPHAVLLVSPSTGRTISRKSAQSSVAPGSPDCRILDRRWCDAARAAGAGGRLFERASLGEDDRHGMARLGPRDLLPSLDRRAGL